MLPIFTSDGSIGRSILTIEPDKEIKEDKPVSILAIAKEHKLDRAIIVDDNFSQFWKIYRNAAKLGVKFSYGLRFVVCNNIEDKTEQSVDSESKVIVFLNNTDSYKDIIRLYTKASVDGFYKKARIDWNTLQKLWTGNLSLAVPFYSSFLARNLLRYGHSARPEFGNIQPVFFKESHDLPFDGIIQKSLQKYIDSHNFPVLNTHQIYYYKNSDWRNLLTMKCIVTPAKGSRRTWEAPNLDHYCSDAFSFEHYQEVAK